MRLLDVGLDPDFVRVVQHQDALARRHIFAGQHEGAVDHGRHRALDGTIVDVDLLLVHLRRKIGDLMGQRLDLRIDHMQPFLAGARLVETAFGLLVLGHHLQELDFELGHDGLRRLELALVDHPRAEQRLGPVELELGEIEIGLQRLPRLLAHRHTGRLRLHRRFDQLAAERALGLQPRPLRPDPLDLRLEGFDLELGDAVIDSGHDLPGLDPRALERRHLDQPAFGTAGNRHDVGRGASVVLVDMGEAQIGFVGAIGDGGQQHGGNGHETRTQEKLAATAFGPTDLTLCRIEGGRGNRLIQGVNHKDETFF